jgi:hypothetical protein
VDWDYYAWRIQLLLSLLFAIHVARLARGKGRSPLGAAILMIASANLWPLVFELAGRLVAATFALQDPARATFVRIVSYGGIMFGVATSYAIVGCMQSRHPSSRIGQGRI